MSHSEHVDFSSLIKTTVSPTMTSPGREGVTKSMVPLVLFRIQFVRIVMTGKFL
jgi:hypothetical protein